MPTRQERFLMDFGPPPQYGGGYYPERGLGTLQSLLMQQGRSRAESALRSGDIWANTLANVGQTLAGGIQQHAEEKKKKTRDDAYLAIMNDPKALEDPMYARQQFLRVGGPEDGSRMFQAYAGGLQLLQPNRDPEKDQKGAAAAINGLKGMKPEARAQVWQHLSAPASKVFGAQLPQQYDDKFFNEVLVPFAESLTPPKPGKFSTVPTAEGIKSFNEETGAAGPVIGQPPAPKPPVPAFQSKDVLLDGRPAMVNFDSHSGRYSIGDRDVTDRVRPIPPQGPAPRQPDWKEGEDAQGNPVLVDYATGQTKPYPAGAMPKPGATEANRIAAAEAALSSSAEVKSYLAKPEVRAAIGPMMGRFNSLAQAYGAGDPVAVELVGLLKSYSALQPQIHGFRNVRFAQDIEALLNTHQTPETLEAALRGIDSAAISVRDRRRGAKGADNGPAKPASKAEYDKLPSGTQFLDPNGVLRIKP